MTQIQTSRAFIKAREAWLMELRSACLVLSDKPHSVVDAISVTQRFVELDTPERESLVSLAANLAGEYGLTATVVDSGAWLTARMARIAGGASQDVEAPQHDEPAVAAQPRHRGVLAVLMAHFRPSAKVLDKALEAATTAESLEIS